MDSSQYGMVNFEHNTRTSSFEERKEVHLPQSLSLSGFFSGELLDKVCEIFGGGDSLADYMNVFFKSNALLAPTKKSRLSIELPQPV